MPLSQFIVNGLVSGAVFALVATGFSLVHSTTKTLNFAHGAVIAVSGYVLYQFFRVMGIDFWFSAFIAVVLAVIVGLMFNELVYRRLRKRRASSTVLLIASLALLLASESVLQVLFGADVKAVNVEREKGLEILDFTITPLQLSIIVTALLLFFGLGFLMKRTKVGKAMRAVSGNNELAQVSGIDSERVYTYSYAIASLIAAVGGILVSLEQNLKPTMATSLIVYGFTGAIIGGVGSVEGAVLGSFLLGLAINLAVIFLPSAFQTGIGFALLFLFLVFRPHGVLGRKEAEQ